MSRAAAANLSDTQLRYVQRHAQGLPLPLASSAR